MLDAMRERAIAIRNATPEPGSGLLREDPVPYAFAKARAAGLEPIVSNPGDLPRQTIQAEKKPWKK